MIKKISELTEQDKEKFLKNVKKSMALEQGTPWELMETMIQAELDTVFDEGGCYQNNPNFAKDAELLRKEFGKNKPSIVDYMLWSSKFVTHSEYVEINDE